MNLKTPYPVGGFDEVAIFRQKATSRNKCQEKRKSIAMNTTFEDGLGARQIVRTDDESSMYFTEAKTRKDSGTDHNTEWDEEDKGMYIEVIQSRPIPNGQDTQKALSGIQVPNFSLTSTLVSSTQVSATRDLPKQNLSQRTKVGENYPSGCTVQQSCSLTSSIANSLLTLRNSLESLDNLIDRSQIPILIRHRTAIKIVLILIITWQFSSLIDQSAHYIRKLCGL